MKCWLVKGLTGAKKKQKKNDACVYNVARASKLPWLPWYVAWEWHLLIPPVHSSTFAVHKVTRVQWNWAAQNKHLFWVQQPHCFYTYPYKNSPHIKNGTIIAQTKINCWCGLIIFMIPNHTHSPVAVHDALYMSPKHSLLLVQTNFDAKLLFFFDGNSQHIPGLNVRVWQM